MLFFRLVLPVAPGCEPGDSGVSEMSSKNFGFLLTTAGGLVEEVRRGTSVVDRRRLEQPEANHNINSATTIRRKVITGFLVSAGKKIANLVKIKFVPIMWR